MLVTRLINLTFRLGTGTFGTTGSNTVTVTGMRVEATINQCANAFSGCSADLKIYGLTPSLMNALSALNSATEIVQQNVIIISAGDAVNGVSVVFCGQILTSQIDLTGSPNAVLNISAFSGYFEGVMLASPSSYRNNADAAVIIANLAAQMGRNFEGNGVSVMLSTPYFAGTPMDQARKCAEAAHLNLFDDGVTLAIWPIGGKRGGVIPLISPATGLVGYPSYSSGQTGLAVTSIFNPNITMGGLVQIKSSLQVANGKWRAFNITHELESQTVSGAWLTHFEANPYVNI
jgi:hypothetical protein